jgi:hypothetical protein
MPALVAGIQVSVLRQNKDVDGRNKSGHDDFRRLLAEDFHRRGSDGNPLVAHGAAAHSLAVSEILMPSFCSSASTRLSAGSGWATQPSMVFHLPSWIIAMRVT